MPLPNFPVPFPNRKKNRAGGGVGILGRKQLGEADLRRQKCSSQHLKWSSGHFYLPVVLYEQQYCSQRISGNKMLATSQPKEYCYYYSKVSNGGGEVELGHNFTNTPFCTTLPPLQICSPAEQFYLCLRWKTYSVEICSIYIYPNVGFGCRTCALHVCRLNINNGSVDIISTPARAHTHTALYR